MLDIYVMLCIISKLEDLKTMWEGLCRLDVMTIPSDERNLSIYELWYLEEGSWIRGAENKG